MFKFLLGRGKVNAVQETQRQTVKRVVGELNEIVEALDEKPTLSVNMKTGRIEVDLPEQMPDEALALPAPDKDVAEPKEAGQDQAA